MRPFHFVVVALLCFFTTHVASTEETDASSASKDEAKTADLAPVPQLRGSEFSTSIAKGVWWVEFFSPQCIHCLQFAPTWAEMYNEFHLEDFHIAKVSCIEDGDLCNEQDVSSYPSLFMYNDGKLIDKYSSANRKKEVLTEYATKKHAEAKGLTIPEGSDTTDTAKATAADTTPSEKNPAAPNDAGKKATGPVGAFPTYPSNTEIVNTKYPSPTIVPAEIDESVPNPNGESFVFDHKSFIRRVTATTDPWFIKFYSPRCPHCLEMGPAWKEVAKVMRNKLNVGEVNCDIFGHLCKDAGVQKIPHIMEFSGSLQVVYDGLRGFADLAGYAQGIVDAQTVPEVVSLDQVLSDNMDEQVPFIYFYDKSTVSEDFQALRRTAAMTIHQAKFYKSNSPELAKKMGVKDFPSIHAVVSTEKYMTFPYSTPMDIRNLDLVCGWIKEVWLSIVPQLTPANSKIIFDHSKYVVMALIDPRNEKEKQRLVKEMRATALNFRDVVEEEVRQKIKELRTKKNLLQEEAEDSGDENAAKNAKKIRVEVPKSPVVGFCWVDAVFWERWITTRYGNDFNKLPRVIVNDQANGVYWDSNGRGGKIGVSRTQLLDVLEQVVERTPPGIRPKILVLGFTSYMHLLFRWFGDHWPYFVILAILGFVVHNKRKGDGRSHNGKGGLSYLPVSNSEKID